MICEDSVFLTYDWIVRAYDLKQLPTDDIFSIIVFTDSARLIVERIARILGYEIRDRRYVHNLACIIFMHSEKVASMSPIRVRGIEEFVLHELRRSLKEVEYAQ